MSFSNAVFAGLGVGNALTSGFANLAQTRRDATLFPLQVKSLNASIAAQEEQTNRLKELSRAEKQANDLLQGLFFQTGGDEGILDAMAATSEALQALQGQASPGFVGPPATPQQAATSGFFQQQAAPFSLDRPGGPAQAAAAPTTLAGILEQKRAERRALRDQKYAERAAAKAADRRDSVLRLLGRTVEYGDLDLGSLDPSLLDELIRNLEETGELKQIQLRQDRNARRELRGPF